MHGLQRAALQNMSSVLQAAGSSLNHIVKANIYMSNMQRDFSPMNEVYIEVRARLFFLRFTSDIFMLSFLMPTTCLLERVLGSRVCHLVQM